MPRTYTAEEIRYRLDALANLDLLERLDALLAGGRLQMSTTRYPCVGFIRERCFRPVAIDGDLCDTCKRQAASGGEGE